MGNWSFSEFVLIAIDVFPSSKGGQIVTDPMFFFDPIRTSEELPANISCPICWCLTIFVAQKNRPFRDFLVYVGNMLLSSWDDTPPFLMPHIFSREVLPGCYHPGMMLPLFWCPTYSQEKSCHVTGKGVVQSEWLVVSQGLQGPRWKHVADDRDTAEWALVALEHI